LTVRTPEAAEAWLDVGSFRIEAPAGEPRSYEVERSRAYRDRLVLKLKGIDDATTAGNLRGAAVLVARDAAPALPEGLHYVAELEGLTVVDLQGKEIGRVVGVVPAGDADVLRVQPSGEEEHEELLIPMAPEFVRSIDPDRGTIEADLPPELLELNRRPD